MQLFHLHLYLPHPLRARHLSRNFAPDTTNLPDNILVHFANNNPRLLRGNDLGIEANESEDIDVLTPPTFYFSEAGGPVFHDGIAPDGYRAGTLPFAILI